MRSKVIIAFFLHCCVLCWHVTTSHARLRPGQPKDTPESRLNLFPPRSDLQDIQEKSFQYYQLTSYHWIPRCYSWIEDLRQFGIQRWSSRPTGTSLSSPSSSLSPSSSSSSAASCWSASRLTSLVVAWEALLSAEDPFPRLACICLILLDSQRRPGIKRFQISTSKMILKTSCCSQLTILHSLLNTSSISSWSISPLPSLKIFSKPTSSRYESKVNSTKT